MVSQMEKIPQVFLQRKQTQDAILICHIDVMMDHVDHKRKIAHNMQDVQILNYHLDVVQEFVPKICNHALLIKKLIQHVPLDLLDVKMDFVDIHALNLMDVH